MIGKEYIQINQGDDASCVTTKYKTSLVDENMSTKEFGELMKGFRKLKGLSQSKLSDISDVPLRTLQRMEHGENVTIDMVLKVLKSLEIEIGFNTIQEK